MKVQLTHKLEFTTTAPPMLSELEGMIETALKNGFDRSATVYIRAGTDDRDHDYSFHASIGSEPVAQEREK